MTQATEEKASTAQTTAPCLTLPPNTKVDKEKCKKVHPMHRAALDSPKPNNDWRWHSKATLPVTLQRLQP
jgi:hypothetical protein